jgi:hypothetical protein
MDVNISLNDLGTLVAVVAGTAAFVLGVLNYLRDRATVSVELQWDMKAMNAPGYDPAKSWGVIRVTNTGRRPAYVSHVAIKLPKGYEGSHLLVMEGLQGQKLEEGAPPLVFPVKQEGLEEYAKDWKKLRAQVSDSTGKVWQSPRKWRGEPPSWAKNSNAS